MVLVRFFAAARAAVGADSVEVEADSIEHVVARWNNPVLARCSFLVNGVATTDRATRLTDGDSLDVLPPFAGG
ncbi:MAG TPA: MoaD/ThiS family protein [Galbitalea sp.]|jgi:molybdopterin converting factor small subunit|nr:MoaD/ThiS family protein [Galbitalea sp.]